MKYIAIVDTDEFKDFEFFEDADGKYLAVKDVNAKSNKWLPLHFEALTEQVLADSLMEERIRGSLKSDMTFKKDIIRDVECILTVSIRDRRPCYCGAELKEVWRESEE